MLNKNKKQKIANVRAINTVCGRNKIPPFTLVPG